MTTKNVSVAIVAAVAIAAHAAELEFTSGRAEAVYKAQITHESGGSLRLKSNSGEWSSGVNLLPASGKTFFNLSAGKYLAVDVENLSSSRQMRLTMHIKGENGTEANTGIGLNAGEKGTMRLHLPHKSVYEWPSGAKGVRVIDTTRVTNVWFMMQWVYEKEFTGLLDCRLSNIRLEGRPETGRHVASAGYLPFVDKYGQFKHYDWKHKVKSDAELVADLAAERAALQGPPDSWDSYGGWRFGPQRTATGHFRVEKVDGKWWFVTPEGHLFYSLGINVLRIDSDAPNGLSHPDWYETTAKSSMTFPTWNVQKKFQKTSGVETDYNNFIIQRLDSWGINTIGNWSAGALMKLGRKPYVITAVARPSGVPMLSGTSFYNSTNSSFNSSMRTAVQNAVNNDTALKKATTDPYCIGFFIDNELSFPSDSVLYEPYFKACKEAIAAVAPNKLYLGCRFKGVRNGSALMTAASKYCDVVSFNSYCNSVYNVPTDIFSGGTERPILHTEFHFGTLQRGMFSGGLCPVGDQEERARSYMRIVEGGLAHPLIIGNHWFQYRDQPLVGRGDGEAYEVGFVDVCDRPYAPLVNAVRSISSRMYEMR